MTTKKINRKIRYGIVGLGHIAQTAVLPAFKNAANNSELVALISNDEKKLKNLAKEYSVPFVYKSDEIENALLSGEIDALYVATPNDLHKEIVDLAIEHGIHVLCEKPMAVTIEDCTEMVQTARKNNVKLMIAYRLHFEPANLEVIKLCQQGRLGDLKFFNSTFSFQVQDQNNIRLGDQLVGGGPLYDIGTYCINASRYIFGTEPLEVTAFSARSPDPRFTKCDETTSAILRFPNNCLATFTVSFGAADSSDYEIIGSKGKIRLENAYDYAKPMKLKFFEKSGNKVKERIQEFKIRDQFSSELIYFSDCIKKNLEPEPSGVEGLADIKVIKSIMHSLESGRPVSIEPIKKSVRPIKKQEISRPPVKKRKAIHATGPRKH